MPCADSPTWAALSSGRLAPEEVHALRAHAASCATCGPAFAMADEKRRSANDAPTQELSSPLVPPRPAEPAPVLARGDTVGRFVVLDTVGMGGMGAVYSAWDPDLDRRVALKTLHVTGASDPTAHGRMLREAQAMARLSHPNVVNVFEVGDYRGGIFIAMEFVAGVTLRTWERSKRRTWREVLEIFVQAGRGLAAAHAAHLVHRDFKPANVLLGDDGRVRVTDFGVARADGSLEPVGPVPQALGDDSGRISGSFSEPLTRGGFVVGTVGYMSPEQAEAKPPDARSDQFSFCLCLWEALYGQRPWRGTNFAEVTRAVLSDPLPARPRGTEVPAWLHEVMTRGLEKDPARRFPSMESLLAELGRSRDEWKRRWLPYGAVAAAVLTVIGLQLGARARDRGRCAAVPSELAGVWDDAVRAQVTGAFGKVNKPFAQAALASALRALDSHAGEWTVASTQACEDAWVRKVLPENDYRLQSACLAQRKRELGALSAVLSAADEGVVERAGSIAWGLNPVQACTQLARLKADPRLMLGGGDADRVAALQSSLARARSLVDAGKLPLAESLISSAITEARALNRRALEAEALSLQGALHQAAGKFAESADAWTQAALAAQASGFDELLALSAIRLTTVVGFHLNRPAEGHTWDALARATIERLGGDDVLALEQVGAAARLENTEGRPLEAARRHTEALRLAQARLGADHPLLWRIEFDLGTSLVGARDPQQAVPHLERALALREKEASASHPEVAMIRSTLANAYFFAGRTEDSRRAFAQALATREALFGAQSPRLVVTLNNYADTLSKAGKHTDALTMIERASAIARQNFPASHPYVMATTLTRAEVQWALGRRDDARAGVDAVLGMQPPPTAPVLAEAGALRAHLALADGKAKDALALADRAVAAAEKVGPRSAELIQPLLARGEALLLLGDAATALKSLELALAVNDETKPWRVYSADVRFALARAKADAVLAQDALEVYRTAEGQEAKAAAVEKFLSAQR